MYVMTIISLVFRTGYFDHMNLHSSKPIFFLVDAMPLESCDASVLLDSTSSLESDMDAEVNDSLHGFGEIKSRLEPTCPGTVSCADALALASRDAVALLGGPAWNVLLGHKDARAANRSAAEEYLPSPHANLAAFEVHGLDARDAVALSGSHTVGRARCRHYRDEESGAAAADNSIDPAFAEVLRRTCDAGGDDTEAPFDEQSPMRFDNAYYRDLIARRGLLTSDQALYGCGGPLDNLVRMYSADGEAFARDFARAMVKMGNIPPPPGMPVEVSLDCRRISY
jgi:peroxidase